MSIVPHITAGCLAGAFTLPAQAELLTHRDLSYPMARTIAEAVIESCGAKG
jgi:hypothetical protein